MEDAAELARLITALRPWLGELVLVGGWAHRLYGFHELATPPAHLPLRTRDADLAFSTDTTLAGDIRTALIGAGFSEELFGHDTPPASHYRLGNEFGFYAEFLTPLYGSGIKRSGAPDATISKAGITAQKMRYLQVLLVSPWAIRVGPNIGVPLATDLDVMVPNPMSFIVQKLLIHTDRPPHKRAQDLLYILDTLELFGGSLDHLRRLWLDLSHTLPTKTVKRAEAIARGLFGKASDKTIDEAVRLPQDRRLTPEDFRTACEYGLGEVFDHREETERRDLPMPPALARPVKKVDRNR